MVLEFLLNTINLEITQRRIVELKLVLEGLHIGTEPYKVHANKLPGGTNISYGVPRTKSGLRIFICTFFKPQIVVCTLSGGTIHPFLQRIFRLLLD